MPASSSSRPIAFHEVDRKTGERLHHRKVATDDAPVETADVAKGYEYEKGKYLVIEPDDLKKLRLPGQKTLSLEHFVPRDSIDPAYFEKPYYVIPKDATQSRTLATISAALRESGRVGLAEITFSGREHFVALAPPLDDTPWLNLYLLRYQEELRPAADYYKDLETPSVDKRQLGLAQQLIESYSEAFQPSEFKDDYETALREFVEAKLHNRPLPKAPPEPKTGKVIDLMEALKRSIEQKKANEKRSAHPAAHDETATRTRARRHKAA